MNAGLQHERRWIGINGVYRSECCHKVTIILIGVGGVFVILVLVLVIGFVCDCV